ncbi:ABC transporter permease, partial [Escherichia coli]|nr:ABC transporter permease [Escherichia coli]
IATMVIATAVSVPAAYALARYRFRGKAFVEQLVALPITYPLVMLGLALLLVFNALPFNLGLTRLIIAHV